MFEDPRGPIEHFSWARFVVCGEEHAKTEAGRIGKGKDIRVIGRDVTRWKEREGHRLAPAMITGVYDRGIEVLIIGQGVHSALECPPEVVESIRAHGVPEVILEPTTKACATYNRLFHAGRQVALLAHGTC